MSNMTHQNSFLRFKLIYTILLFASIAFSLHSFFKPGIVAPQYPASLIRNSLNEINGDKLTSTSMTTLENDSTDRKPSALYAYKYNSGSEIRASLVRVKKRDDFKIETYGLLTKNLDPIYIRNPISNISVPFSSSGKIGSRDAIQTCIIPHTTKIEQADIRLQPLTTIAENLKPSTSNFFYDKILGKKKTVEYTCLVLTYLPVKNFSNLANNSAEYLNQVRNWQTIVQSVQTALLKI
jgi:hypothetical protein